MHCSSSDLVRVQQPLRSDDQQIARGVNARDEERLGRCNAQASSLTYRIGPDAPVRAYQLAALIDHRPRLHGVRARASNILVIDALVYEADLLAFWLICNGEAKRSRKGTEFILF